MFEKMFLVVKIFCQPQRKRVIENKQAFGGTHAKDYSSLDFRDIVNLKLLHLVHIYIRMPIISLKKIIINFREFFEKSIFFSAKLTTLI